MLGARNTFQGLAFRLLQWGFDFDVLRNLDMLRGLRLRMLKVHEHADEAASHQDLQP